jgi:ribose 5-phosphate isomerase B
MRISVAADELTGVARALLDELRRRGHETLAHGALGEGGRKDWAWASEAAARDVAEQRAEQAIVCCWTGTGSSIAANKVGGVRAAGARPALRPAQAPASAAKAGLWERSRRSMPYQSLLP